MDGDVQQMTVAALESLRTKLKKLRLAGSILPSELWDLSIVERELEERREETPA